MASGGGSDIYEVVIRDDMTGKLMLEGDVMFASQMTSFFRIPTASG